MRKFIPLLIILIIWTGLHSTTVYAETLLKTNNTNERCLTNVPVYNPPAIEKSGQHLPVKIETDTLKAQIPNKVTYQGNVRVSQGNRHLNAEKLTIETRPDTTHFMTITGNINYFDKFLTLHGRQANMTIENNDIDIEQGQYHLINRLGRGSAKTLSLRNDRYIILKYGNFTTCPIGQNSWSMSGTTIVHDNEKELLEVWNAVFKVGPIPIFYSPYLQYPTGNKRRSGLLIPSFNHNNVDGLNVAIPFYWNIAANMDATITPRLIQHRGFQVQTETRYLNGLGLGAFAFDWLDHDSLYDRNKTKLHSDIGDNKNRWLLHWDHDGLIDHHWRITTDMTRVSDRQYLIDLNSNHAHLTDGYLTQHYQLGYANEDWSMSLSSTNFQIFRSALKDNVYRTEPQLDINYYHNFTTPLRFTTYAQIVHFTSPGKDNPQTIRTHISPTLSYLLSTNWASLNSEASLLTTHYSQDLTTSNRPSELNSNVTRVMPKLSLDGRVVFERNSHFMHNFTQTLEPRIKYQYVPYRDQSAIKNYDSALLQLDYTGLFRDQIYSGLDRIASANQLSTGITSRLYDENLIDRFDFSLGQIYYFKQPRTGDNALHTDKEKGTGSVNWATDVFLRINQNAILRGTLQYDTRLDELSLANGVFEYKPSMNTLFQLSYRYANEKYINSIDLATKSPYEQAISQVGAVVSLPFNDSIAMVGSYYYDTKLKQSADGFIGLQYSNCCWGVNLIYGRRIVNWEDATDRSEYDNKFSINFELRGFSNNRNNIIKMFNFGSLPYRNVFE